MRRTWLVVLGVALVACGTPVRDLTSTDLEGYRIVYAVDDFSAGTDKRSATELLEVRRPYDGRVEVRRDGEVIDGRVTSRAHFWQLGKGEKPRFGVIRAPGGPTRDASASALRDAVRAGRAQRLGSGEVLGTPCAWFAYRDPVPAPLAVPTSKARVESCVDGSGIVLREVWTLDGKPARILEATEVQRDAPSKKRFFEGRDPQTFDVTDPKGAEFLETNTIVRDVAGGRIASPFDFDKPKGWTRDRVVLVGTTVQGARPTQYLSRTYVRNDQLVIIETASGSEFVPPWETREGTRIEIGAGEGRVLFFVDRVEIRLLSQIGFARVVAPSRALAFEFIRGLSA